MSVVWVALGGAIGAASRYGVNLWGARLASDFPWATLIVNVIGCLAMGVITMLAMTKLSLSHEMKLFLTTGVLGGFTTFSAFALDFATLLERKALLSAGTYVVSSVILSLLAVLLGMAMVRTFTS